MKRKKRNERPEAWKIVERAYAEMQRRDLLLTDCLPTTLDTFQRELVAAAFATGRRSYADDCDDDVEIMRELGLG